MGYYIQTELKAIFQTLNINQNRYSIPVPITEYEKELFASSVTPEEDAMDNILLKLKDAYEGIPAGYAEFMKQGFVPTLMLEDSNSIAKVGKTKVVKLLRSNGYLTNAKADRPAIKKDRQYCYIATPLLMTYLQA